MCAKICFSAGEASGDKHAADVFAALKKYNSDIVGIGMGGFAMQSVGIKLAVNSSELGVIGVVEVFKKYLIIHRALKKMQCLLLNEKPDLLVCVDYKEFNYQLARFAKKNGIKVLFYVSPQVWAWRKNRVKKYGAVIDKMAVIFPFETAYYEAENVPVEYVGHPCVDGVKPQREKSQALIDFSLNSNAPIIGLVAGSRQNEVKKLLPVMLKAAEKLYQSFPHCQFVLPQANSIDDSFLAELLEQNTLNIKVIKNKPYDVMQCCDAIMSCSGTATLEIALLGVPMVICYKLSSLTYFLGKLLVKTPFIGLPNIIAGKLIVKELIQQEATAENLYQEINQILTNTTYNQQIRQQLHEIKNQLGCGGTSETMARIVLDDFLKIKR